MSYLISNVYGQESVDRVPCDPEAVESFTNEKFKNLPKEDIVSFQENGVYFCFDRAGLREWVKRGNRTNPLTRQELRAEVIETLGHVQSQDFLAKIVFSNYGDGCEVSNLEVLNYQANNYEKILLHFKEDVFGQPMFEVDEVKRTHVTLQIVNLLTYDRDSTKRDFTVDGVTYKARTKKEVTQPKQQEGNQFGNVQPMEHPETGLPCGVFGLYVALIRPSQN